MTGPTMSSRYDRARVFYRDARGNIALSFGLLTPILAGCLAIASNAVTMNYKALKLQTTSDQAVIAATQELLVASSTDKTIHASAQAYVDSVHPGEGVIVKPPSVDRAEGQVRIQLEYAFKPLFGSLMNSESTPILATSSAKLIGEANVCILALSEATDNPALDMRKTSKVTANGCGVFSNSKASNSIFLDRPAKISADVVCSAGGVEGGVGSITPSAKTDCTPIPDPLASRPEPPIGVCDETNFKASKGLVTLKPGTYCGGIMLSSQVQAQFEPGLYTLVNGGLKITGQASAVGTDVGFYLASANSKLDLTGNSTISLSGAESGDLAGLLFFASRSQTEATQHRIAGGMIDKLTGTIYFPTSNLLIDPKGATVAEQSEYTVIIANKVRMNEGPEIILNSDYGASSVPVPDGITVSGTVVLTE
jgi:Flp pilus assembly protein TadG